MNTNVLVAYGTKYGATAEMANEIGNVLQQSGLQVTVASADRIQDLTPYQAVVLGSAVYAGQWRKEAANFLQLHAAELASKVVWLFSSGPSGAGDPVVTMRGWRFPQNLQPIADHIKPRDIAFFHGKIDLDELHLGDKLIIMAMNVATGDFRNWDAIRAWAKKIAEQIEPAPDPGCICGIETGVSDESALRARETQDA